MEYSILIKSHEELETFKEIMNNRNFKTAANTSVSEFKFRKEMYVFFKDNDLQSIMQMTIFDDNDVEFHVKPTKQITLEEFIML